MNVTVATELIRRDFKWTHAKYESAARKAPAGSDGLMLLPYLEGERTPNVPDGTGVYFGVRPKTFTEKHFARATMEGVTMGMNYGLFKLVICLNQHLLSMTVEFIFLGKIPGMFWMQEMEKNSASSYFASTFL